MKSKTISLLYVYMYIAAIEVMICKADKQKYFVVNMRLKIYQISPYN